MAKSKIIIFSITFLILSGFILSEHLCQAKVDLKEDFSLRKLVYQKTSPLNVSPKPDIIQDREFREERSVDSSQPSESAPETELSPTETSIREKPLVASKPTKIYYQIAVNDKLFISVWRVPDLSLEFIVGPDGKISFPLIGDIDAAGRTLAELDIEITEKLKEYVVNPQVSVMVREFAGDKLTIIGEVRNPGIYKFVGSTNIMSVIALAGGFTDRAKSSQIIIVREPQDSSGEPQFIVADIKEILKGNLSKNISVLPNDIVYVSRTMVSNFKEFWDGWIAPIMGEAIDYETYKSIRRDRHN
ncbi:MAG: polysaccharide biosynthesis/export family protein [Candidatus Omnitrophota bacterium]